jgi:hypothetical protein
MPRTGLRVVVRQRLRSNDCTAECRRRLRRERTTQALRVRLRPFDSPSSNLTWFGSSDGSRDEHEVGRGGSAVGVEYEAIGMGGDPAKVASIIIHKVLHAGHVRTYFPEGAVKRPLLPRIAFLQKTLRGSRAMLAMILVRIGLREASWTATRTPKHPFEPSSKRRRGFPLASPASSAATASSAPTPNSSRGSAATTPARAARAAAFRRCCRRTGRFDGTQANYYVRDQ